MTPASTARPDRVVAVDWSAAATPRRGADSIWQADRGPDGTVALTNPATRAEWAEAVAASLTARVDAGERVLLAIDAGLGFPTGFAAALGFGAGPAAWRRTSQLVDDLVVDSAGNRNNRFEVAEELNRRAGAAEGPFWGHPHGRRHDRLRPTRPVAPVVARGRVLPEWRAAEAVARRAGWRVQPVWKLWGAGSVGGQTLLALAWVERLRREPGVRDRLRVWPQEVAPATADDPWAGVPGVVVVECWPPAFVAEGSHDVRDAAQVLGASTRLGAVTEWSVPVDGAREEGWIVGVAAADG